MNTTNHDVNVDVSSLNTIMVSLVVVALFSALPQRLLNSIPVVYVMLLTMMVFSFALLWSGVDMAEFFGTLYVSKANSSFLQALYLPPLIFSEVFKLNLASFQRTWWQVVWLILPGVVFGAALTALFVMYMMPSGPPYFTAFEAMCFGGAMSATDPIAVMIVLHEMGAPARLRALVGGESLLNDGSSIVLVTLFLELIEGRQFTFWDVVLFCLEELIAAPMIGAAVGLITLMIMRLLEDNVIPLVTLSLASPYIAFILSANTFGFSGVMSLIAMGLVMNRFGRAILNTHMHNVEAFWVQIDFIALALLYTQSGIYMGHNLFMGGITSQDWGSLFALYFWITLVRALMVTLSFPLLRRIGYGMNWKEGVIMVHGGLRGSLCILLSFAIAGTPGVSPKTASLTLFFASGIVLLMCINVVTTAPLCELLGIRFDKTSPVYLILKQKLEDSTAKTLRATRSSISAVQEEAPEQPALEQVKESIEAKRFHLALAMKQTFEQLLETRLIGRSAWFTLLVATEKLMEEHDHTSPRLLTWDDIHTSLPLLRVRMFNSREVYQGVCDLLEEEDGDDESTLTPARFEHTNPVVEHFAYCAYAMLLAHERVRAIIQDTFAVDRDVLLQESLLASETPARLLNRAMISFPKAIERMKRKHVRAQVHEHNVAAIAAMQANGILNEIVLKQLWLEVAALDKRITNMRFALEPPLTVGAHGEQLLGNPNFGPFRDIIKQPEV